MEVENHHLFAVENGLPFGAILHFHVSSKECIFHSPFLELGKVTSSRSTGVLLVMDVN